MSILSNKFVITKGIANDFIITIKQNGSTLPMVITANDEFECVVTNIDTDAEVFRISEVSNSNGVITILSMPNGKINLSFTTAAVNSLIKNRGPKEDRYYVKPTYKISLNCNTTNNGNFVAKIPEVYVD